MWRNFEYLFYVIRSTQMVLIIVLGRLKILLEPKTSDRQRKCIESTTVKLCNIQYSVSLMNLRKI